MALSESQPLLTARDAKTVARIVKVNHAGEYGAIRIYRAQILIARRLFPDVADCLEAMLAHELDHCAAFRSAMAGRNARPCRIMQLWGWGGYVLGLMTALTGRQAIWTCTAAVEAAVHRHLDDQLRFLVGRDLELHAIILKIREEELSHLSQAEMNLRAPNFFRQTLRRFIAGVTDAVIWLSTWGDSARMAQDLRRSAIS
jgi:ubiquinone biosynthesis monooxygenase Coq7